MLGREMAMKPSQSYFLIDLIGGGVLIGANGTLPPLHAPLGRPAPAVAAFRMPRGDSEIIRGVEFHYGGYPPRLSRTQLPLVITQTRLWAFPLLDGQ